MKKLMNRICFSPETRERVEGGVMRAIIVRGKGPDEIAGFLNVLAGGDVIGRGGVTAVRRLQVYGNGLNLGRLDDDRAIPFENLRKVLSDLGLDRAEFYAEMRPNPFSGCVVWFDFEPMPMPVMEVV